jgi:hypothetical protein
MVDCVGHHMKEAATAAQAKMRSAVFMRGPTSQPGIAEFFFPRHRSL